MNPLRIIIVEDDARIADLHRRFVERVEGFVVAGIAHGLADARDMAFVLEPDLILLDLYFPEGSGMDLLRDVRAKGLETDVILITAAREVGAVKEALRGGVFDYIIKPVIAARFTDCLEKFRAYRARLAGEDAVEQRDVDSLLRPAGGAGGTGGRGGQPRFRRGVAQGHRRPDAGQGARRVPQCRRPGRPFSGGYGRSRRRQPFHGAALSGISGLRGRGGAGCGLWCRGAARTALFQR